MSHQPENNPVSQEQDYHFHGQRPKELIRFVRNQHFVVLIPKLAPSVLSLIIPYLLIRFSSGAFLMYSLLAYAVVLGFYVSYHIYAYVNGSCILTNERIINIEQMGFFNRRISEAELDRIQDVTTNIDGIFPTVFNFGNVAIRTASSESLLVLKNIPQPYDIQQGIVKEMKQVARNN